MIHRLLSCLASIKWLVCGKPKWVYRNDVWLPCFQDGIAKEISASILSGSYEAKELALVKRHLEPKDIVLELGAGIGCISSFCAKVLGPGRVFAVEANENLTPIILATFARNSVHPHLENVILGKGDGDAKFFVSASFWESSTTGDVSRMKPVEVKQVDFSRKLAATKATFLIVDIEGGEADLFDDADLSGVTKICLETHEDMIGNARTSMIFANLLRQGFILDFKLVYRNVYYFYKP